VTAKLELMDGPLKGQTFDIDKEEVIIGRSGSADIQMGDKMVSRKHAVIVRRNTEYFLEDAGSQFGTLLNDQPVRQARLRHGDVIRIGRNSLKFLAATAGPLPTDADFQMYESQFLAFRESDVEDVTRVDIRPGQTIQWTVDRLRSLLDLSRVLHDSLDLGTVLNRILDRLYEVFKPDRGYILLVDGSTGNPTPAAVKIGDRQTTALDRIPLSRTICDRVIRSKQAVITSDATGDGRFASGESVHAFSIRSAMCAPLIHRQSVVGLIHLDNEGLDRHFTEEDLALLIAISGSAASAVSNAMLTRDIGEHERVRSNLARFFSPAVVEQIIAARQESGLKGDRMKVSVLFTDLREFTTMSQALDAERVVVLLNRYFTMAVANVFSNGGTLDKFLGDGLMAFFGAPEPQEDAAARAVRAAAGIVQGTAWLNGAVAADGLPPIRVGLAISTGEAIVGTIGSPDRLEYTAIGSTVNLCARLCGIASPGAILVDGPTASEIKNEFAVTDKGKTRLKGFENEVPYFSVEPTGND